MDPKCGRPDTFKQSCQGAWVILTQLEFNLLLGRTSPSSGVFPHVNNCGHTEVGSDLTVKKKPPHLTK